MPVGSGDSLQPIPVIVTHNATVILTTIAYAAAFGILAQLIGHRLGMSALVPLLVFGMLLGPSGLGWIRPDTLGAGLGIIVKLAVAIILFEGALNLRLGDLRGSALEVRGLVTTGVLITWVGALLAARWITDLRWPLAIVFGALVTVTGPTVVQPLLKRLDLPRNVRTTLEGEAILIDPIGAILALAVFDIVLGLAGVHPIGIASAAWAYFGRLLVGLAAGVAGALVLSRILRTPRLVPTELVSLVALATTWGVFAVAEQVQNEAGIMAAVVMGLVLQHEAIPEERRLRQFKEQLTVLGISLLFILLSANLPFSVLRAEGWRGPLLVLALMFIVRPLSVATALRGSTMTRRERLFIMFISPRGIVAASVASLFAVTLADAGRPGGDRLLALTFLTIAITVTVQGLLAAPVARALHLHSLQGRRAIVIGAGPLGRAVATLLRDGGRNVIVVDRNEGMLARAAALGLDVLSGNALDEAVLERADANNAESVVALTTNSEVNVLAVQLAREAFGVRLTYPALAEPAHGASEQLLVRAGGSLAFAAPLDIRAWDDALARNRARVDHVTLPEDWKSRRVNEVQITDTEVPLVRIRNREAAVVHEQQDWVAGDVIAMLVTDTNASAFTTRPPL